jgi:hypothetical protein
VPRDQRFTAGQVRLSIGRFGFGNRCIGLGHDARVTLRQDQRMSGGKIRWQRFNFRCHSARIAPALTAANPSPAHFNLIDGSPAD